MLIMTLARYRRRLQSIAVAPHDNVSQFGAHGIALRPPPLTIAPEIFINVNQFGGMAVALASDTQTLAPTTFNNTNQFGAMAVENDEPVVTDYGNAGGTGDRTGSITVTSSSGLFAVGTLGKAINGVTSAFDWYFNNSAPSPWMKFDFGTPRVIDEFKWYQSNNTAHGTWQWQGSNDDSSYSDVGSTFTLDGPIGGGPKTISQPAGNTTAYRYWKMVQTSGITNGGPWLYEIEFKIY